MDNAKKTFNLFSISEARNVIFGIATLWIGFFHSGKLTMEQFTGNRFIIDAFDFFRNTGNVGVDMFLFLSGIGLYFSFSADSNIRSFWKKRLARVLPTSILIVTLMVSFRYCNGKYKSGLTEYISRLSFFNFYWKGERVFWFISLILLLYLLFPVIYKIIDRFRWKGMLGLVVFIIIFNFTLRAVAPIIYNNIEVALCRIPVFVIGTWAGKFVKEKKCIDRRWLWAVFAVLIASLVLMYFFPDISKALRAASGIKQSTMFSFIYRYASCPAGISFVVLDSFICTELRRRGRCNVLRNFLEFVGMYSMEYYLIYLNLSRYFLDLYDVGQRHVIMTYFGSFVASLVLCVVSRKLCDYFMNYMRRKPKNLDELRARRKKSDQPS